MKNVTARQMANAQYAANAGKGRAIWIVRSKWGRTEKENVSSPMTYREAKAQARAIIEACGYASVERK
jgi:hypothetical protein